MAIFFEPKKNWVQKVVAMVMIFINRGPNRPEVDKCRSNRTELYNRLLQCYGYVNL